MQAQGFGSRALALLFQRGAHGGQLFFVQLAHQLTHVLALAALALEVGDALEFFQAVDQLAGQLERLEQVAPQRQQRLAQRLQLGALRLQLGLAGAVAAQLGLELFVQLAAFGDELAADEIAFLGFAGHG